MGCLSSASRVCVIFNDVLVLSSFSFSFGTFLLASWDDLNVNEIKVSKRFEMRQMSEEAGYVRGINLYDLKLPLLVTTRDYD